MIKEKCDVCGKELKLEVFNVDSLKLYAEITFFNNKVLRIPRFEKTLCEYCLKDENTITILLKQYSQDIGEMGGKGDI